MAVVPTVKINPSHPSQGEFVEINAEDFDPAVHVLFELPPPPPPAELPPPPPPPVDPLAGLPRDWRNKSPQDLRTLAASVSDGRMPENKAQAIQMIEQALAARSQ